MLRRGFNLLAALSLVLCLIATGLWVRSQGAIDTLLLREGRVFNGMRVASDYQLRSSYGHLMWLVEDWTTGVVPNGKSPGETPMPEVAWKRTEDSGLAKIRWISVPWGTDDAALRYPGYPGSNPKIHAMRVYKAPYRVLVFVLALVPLVWLIAWVVRQGEPVAGACPSCGYDLRATPDRCPECGWREA